MIKAIVFDLDGVYFPNGKANFVKALTNLGVSEPEVKRVFAQSEEMNNKYKVGLMSDDDFWAWATKEWKINKTPEELMDTLANAYDVDEKVVEIVKTVRRNGYKTLICSSNFPARVNGLQKRFGFLDNFDAAVFSYDVGVNKPSGVLYQELVKRSGVKAEEIVYADDYEPAVEAAKKIGIIAFLYTDFGQFTNELNNLGVKLV